MPDFPLCLISSQCESAMSQALWETPCSPSRAVFLAGPDAPSQPVRDTVPSPPVKRRRLREKTRPGGSDVASSGGSTTAASPEGKDAAAEPVGEAEELGELDAALTKKFHNAYHWWWRRATNFSKQPLSVQRRLESQYHFRRLPVARRAVRLGEFLEGNPKWQPYAKALREQAEGQLTRRKPGSLRGPTNSLLCTWNGDRGDFSDGLIAPWWEMSLALSLIHI